MKLQNIKHKLAGEETGAALVMVALLMVAMLGFSAFVVDFGMAYVEVSRLQNALDSAALAAVQELPSKDKSAAVSVAIEFASANGYTIDASNIVFDSKGEGAAERYTGITLTSQIDVKYFLAPLIGVGTGPVQRTASSEVETLGGLSGLVPLCITSEDLAYVIAESKTEDITLKFDASKDFEFLLSGDVPGWYGAVRFPGDSGATDYKHNLADGYGDVVSVGDIIAAEHGVMTGPTKSAFNERFDRCTHGGCTVDNYVEGCPRIVFMPVIELVDGKDFKVVGFVSFILEPSSGGKIVGSYLREITVSGSTSEEAADDYGVYVGKLIN